MIKSISKMLKLGGLLYLDVPNVKGLYFRIGSLYQKLRGRDRCVNLAPPFHVFGFNPKAIRILLLKHGLEPRVTRIYGVKSLVPSQVGFVGWAESMVSKIVTQISDLGQMGSYVEIWSKKL